MKYGDVIQFNPIESVVQLRDADDTTEARHLVASYVISEEMAERLETTVFSQLQFDEPADQKGVLVVGNYGTGKSHLMSVISAVAEHADLAGAITNPATARDAAKIAGRFKVIRTEIGAVTMDFREFVCSQLEDALLELGVDYRFPARDEIPNHKVAFDDMMAAFEEEYPDHGLLLVVDELLDYLRTRKDQELILDLSFLREVGEICKSSRFRFMAGVQEAIFESTRFQFAADILLRVKDRFEQFLIARRDVKFVVGRRLLNKTGEQQSRVREHLTPFAKFYGNMHERMDEFVRLFPIHPDYIDTFERISVVEKREVLKSLSQAMRRVLDNDVPVNAPGLISYDSYWDMLRENPAFRAIPSVREVIDVGTKLEERIEVAFPNPAFKSLALRLARALSVHRLTVGDVYSEMGAAANELRDTLCVYDPAVAELGGDPAEDLAGQIFVVLKKARDTVDGTYVGFNRENDQFYLRVTDEPDPDTLIEKRVETLEADSLDRYYFDALKRVMELSDQTLVTGYRIWPHELTWRERNAPRSGYLFFGAPNERSTAQPPREFYLYFLQPYGAPHFRDEKRPDEVFFRLKGPEDDFNEPLAKYAAALDLAATASGQTRSIYESKANGYLQELVRWLREHMASAFDVTYGGRTRPILEWVKGRQAATADTVRDMVDNVASACLAAYFEDQAPEYPKFSVRVTGANLEQAVREALRSISAGGKGTTRQATAVLDALELLDGDRLDPHQSRYAGYVLELLGRKGQGQVTNRDELLRQTPTGEYLAPNRYRLEPAWLVVLLALLVYSGNLVLAIRGKKLTASDLDVLAATPLEDLINFKHVERPKDWDRPALRALFELVGLAPGLVERVTQNDEDPVARLQAEAARIVQRSVIATNTIRNGLPFWGRSLFSEAEGDRYRKSLERLKAFLETLQAYATPAKLKNFRDGEDEVKSYRANLADLEKIEALRGLLGEIGPPAGYLSTAEATLPEEHPLVGKIRGARERALERLDDLASSDGRGELLNELGALKSEYVSTYMALHTRARLGRNEDRRKSDLLYGDERLKRLEKLSNIELMPVQQLTDFKRELAVLKTCYSITSRALEASPLCQECNFKPGLDGSGAPAKNALYQLEEGLERLHQEWTEALLAELEDHSTRKNLDLISPDRKKLIEQFLDSRSLPDPLTQEFVSAVREALSGLEKITVRSDELRAALLDGGAPATPGEMRKRFERFLEARTRGTDPGRVRIVLE